MARLRVTAAHAHRRSELVVREQIQPPPSGTLQYNFHGGIERLGPAERVPQHLHYNGKHSCLHCIWGPASKARQKRRYTAMRA